MGFLIEDNWLVFIILNIVMGGGAAFMAGRALAGGWKSAWLLMAYMVPFAAAIRFLHFALFGGNLTSLHYYIVHGLILVAFALVGYRTTRVNQMTNQYPWLYEKTSPFAWRNKA